ncbi:hypothetical protein RL72_00263 [Microbacterium azadirachtae]|uniref:Uncharacterized protein n=1 Tax=Microbacterium azadirachtae TaxID=582680 RepID=A0A0F0LAA5_9MICO|nr:hypothetical protein RL72_00263 [Microbacterium azadirachtae]
MASARPNVSRSRALEISSPALQPQEGFQFVVFAGSCGVPWPPWSVNPCACGSGNAAEPAGKIVCVRPRGVLIFSASTS